MLEIVYRTISRFVQHLQIQKANINQYKAEIGASSADITEVTNDADVAEFLVEVTDLLEELKKTGNGIKARFFSNKTEPPAGEFMNAPDTTPPAAIIAGAIKRSRERDQRFLNSQGITEAAKIAMDLIGEAAPDVQPETVKPTVEAHSAVTGYEAGLIIGNRQKADSYRVFVQRGINGNREQIDDGTGKAITVHLIPSEPGKAEQVLLTVQLRKNNQNYGVPSDPIYVTFNP